LTPTDIDMAWLSLLYFMDDKVSDHRGNQMQTEVVCDVCVCVCVCVCNMCVCDVCVCVCVCVFICCVCIYMCVCMLCVLDIA